MPAQHQGLPGWMSRAKIHSRWNFEPNLNGTSSKFETPLLWWWFLIMEKGSWMNLWCGRAKAAEVLVDPSRLASAKRYAG